MCGRSHWSTTPRIGRSLHGGGISLIAAGEGHVDASALIMVDIAPRVETKGIDNIQAFMSQKPEGFSSLEEVAEAISTYQQRLRPKNLNGLAKNVRLGRDGKYHWHWDPLFLRAGARDLPGRQERLEACARRLVLPTLLVRGGLSDVLSEDGAQHFLALCAHSEYVNVASADHMAAGDRNDVFGNSMIEFLKRTVPHRGQMLRS